MAADLLKTALFLLFPLAMAYAAVSDLMTMTIANRIVVALVAGFVLAAPVAGMSLETFAWHWAAGLLVLAGTFLCFARGWIGGGDAKLAAAAALWLGWPLMVEFILTAAVFGGLLTLAILAFRSRIIPVTIMRQDWVARLHHAQTGVPYGIALAAAALVVYPHSPWIALTL